MLRTIARGVVLALLMGLAVSIPSAPNARAMTSWPSEPQYAQMQADLAGVEAANQQAIEQGGTLDPATIEYLVSMLPSPVYEQIPLADDLIRGDPNALAVVTHSGATIPGCPAAGLQLLPGFPAPYGFFSTNPTNNWCMPNGPDNGCTAFPDTRSVAGITIYDFRAACRQHDNGYRWVPASKLALDARIFVDAAADCARRNLVIRPFCFSWATVLFTGVFLFGGPSYGNSDRPGYNRQLPIRPLEPAASCAQSSHARLATPGNATTMSRGTVFNMTGVVRRQNRVLFEFFDSSWNLAATHLTYFSDNNCVVRHEPETFNTNRLPLGTVFVTATFAAWEQNETVRRQQIATLQITAGGGTTTCNQPTHAWVYGGPTVTQGAIVYLTGVVHKYSRITFNFYDANGNWITQHLTQPARDNCVVHHEPEWFSTSRLPIGTVRVDATFLEWETDQWMTRQVGTLTVLEPPPPPPGGDDPPPDGCTVYRLECEPIIY
jgi:hypothetical protein